MLGGDARQLVGRRAAGRRASGVPTARTKASKPAGVEVTSQRASVSTRSVCGTPRGARTRVAGAQDVRVVARPQGELAVEDVEALVVEVVDVQRVWSPAGPVDSSRAKAPSVSQAGDVDVDAVAQEPEVGHDGEVLRG